MNTQLNNRDYMYKLIEDKALCDDNIYIVCSDGLDNIIFPEFKKQIPDRIISCGISEQNQISVATGLALGGKRVYCVMLSTFMLHRALDQFKMACYSNANIKFIAFDSGIEEMKAGYSHIAPDDFAILKSTPNLKIYSPSTLNEVEKVVNKTFTENYPVYISADRVDSGLKTTEIDKEGFTIWNEGMTNDCCIFVTGASAHILNRARNINSIFHKLIQKLCRLGVDPTIVSVYQIEPFTTKQFLDIAKKYSTIITLENRGAGGISSIIAEILATNNLKNKFLPIYYDGNYDIVGSQNYVIEKYLTDNSIIEKICKILNKRKSIFFKTSGSNSYGLNTVKIKYKLLGIPMLKLVRKEGKVKKYILGCIKVK